MAGIGFQLKRLLRHGDLTGVLQAYGVAAIVSSGPWMMSIGSLAILSFALRPLIGINESALFFALVTYCYALSLIVSGPLQLAVTRLSADLDYMKKRHAVAAGFVRVLALWLPLMAVVGVLFFVLLLGLKSLTGLAAALLFTILSGTWLVASYLGAIRDYSMVLWCFAVGYTVGSIAAWFLTVVLGTAGALLGFAFGQGILLLSLWAVLQREIGLNFSEPPAVWKGISRYGVLMSTGFFYNLGIWADKILHWGWGPARMQLAERVYAAPLFDQVVYLSYLTILPGMAIFLLKVETDFAFQYERFFSGITAHAPFSELHSAKQGMIAALTEGFGLMAKVQGIVSLLLLIFAADVLPIFGLGALQTGIFRVVVIGSFLLVLFLALLTVLFYLDCQWDALSCSLLFCLGNFIITYLDLTVGEQRFGVGFTLSLVFAVGLGIYRVWQRIENLEYTTFTSQPISV
jgi:uncharacterized membrane protein